MTIRSITFDDEQWQVVPKILAPVMWHAMIAAPTEALAWSCALAAAPEPPAQQPMTEDQILAEIPGIGWGDTVDEVLPVVRAVEAFHGIGKGERDAG